MTAPRKTPPARVAGRARPRARSPRGRFVWLALAAAALAGGAWWYLRVRPAGRDAAARPTPEQAQAAADSVERLVGLRRFCAAIPYARLLERQMPAPDPRFDAQFASVLCNAAIELRSVEGASLAITRSSVERVALIREALARLERADRMAESPAMHRDVEVATARVLSVWGFQRDAYGEFRRAHAAAPLETRERAEATWLERMMEDPTQALVQPPTVISPRTELAPR